MDTDSDSDTSDRPPVDLFVEEVELSDPDQDPATDPTRHYLRNKPIERP